VHLGLAAQTLDIGKKMPLIGAHRAAQTVVVGKRGGKAKGQDGREFEAIGDDAGVISCRLLGISGDACGIDCGVLGDDDREISGRKEEGLVPEQTGDSGQGHRAAVAS